MPLGKLSPVTLTNGLNILKQIVSELNNPVPDREKLKNFSSEFYTQIPHDFGFKKIDGKDVTFASELVQTKYDGADSVVVEYERNGGLSSRGIHHLAVKRKRLD